MADIAYELSPHDFGLLQSLSHVVKVTCELSQFICRDFCIRNAIFILASSDALTGFG